MNGPKKLESYITLGWKGLPETNTLAYWAHLIVAKEQRVLKMTPGLAQNLDESEKNTPDTNPSSNFKGSLMFQSNIRSQPEWST
jgi:hypothetical protein